MTISLTTEQRIIQWIAWSYNVLSLLLCIYMISRFVMKRNELYIKIRVPTLTYIYCIAVALMLSGKIFLEPYNCPFVYCQVSEDGTQSDILVYLERISLAVRITFIGTVFCMKLWYLYYALKLQTLLINNQWAIQINENLINENWWFRNAEKYGRPKKKTWIILSCWMIGIIFFGLIVGITINPLLPRVISYCQVFATILGAVLFYCKIPKMEDIYGMKKEIKYITCFNGFGFFYFPIVNLATGWPQPFHLRIINGFISPTLVFLMTWSVTYFPISLWYKKYDTDTSSMDSTTEDESWDRIIAKDINHLYSFMRFLCRSFCVENMLFLIEMMQCKQNLMSKRSSDSNDTLNPGTMVALYDDINDKNEQIPRSSIVYGNNGFTVNQQIRKIYFKYISDDAALCINISYETREKIKAVVLSEDFMRNQDEQYLLTILDDAIYPILMLLAGAFARFKRENQNDFMDQDIISALQQQTK